ncbi:MAG: hypothetical protein P8010_05990 [Desulfosarcinaceae bacterium]|jgi:hypothetical protein
MTPVYLPFTRLSASTGPAILRFFNPICLYRPQGGPLPEGLKFWHSAGSIEVRIPVQADDEALTRTLAACGQWARERGLGSGEAGAFLKAQPNKAPLYDDDTVGHLRRQILAGGRPDDSAARRDPIFDARLFLAMADAYDGDNETAALQLQTLQGVEEEVLRELHGRAVADANIGPPAAAIAAAEDRGAFMTAARLRAWSILASQGDDLPHLLITDSPAVAAELLERYRGDALETPMLALRLPPEGDGDHAILQTRLLAWLDRVVAAEAPTPLFTPGEADLPVSQGDPSLASFERPFIGLYLLTGCPWDQLLSDLIPREVTPRWRAASGGARHGVLAVIYA